MRQRGKCVTERGLRALFLIASLFCIPAFGNGPGVSVQLNVVPTHVLAGIRPSFRIDVENRTDTDVTLPRKVLLLVTPSIGKPFIAEFSGSQETPYSTAELPVPRTIKAHSHGEFMFAARTLDGPPGWFDDPRLNAPGTYRLQLLLADSVVDSRVGPTPAFKIDTAVNILHRSSEAVLTVEKPEGDDAKLWAYLLVLAQRHHSATWSARYRGGSEWEKFEAEAIAKYPASPYAPLVVRAYSERPGGDRLPPEERLANARRVLQAQPDAPNREDIQLFMAEMEVTSAEHAASGPKADAKRAVELYDRARADFEALERSSSDPEIRARSREERELLPSADDVRELVTERPPAS